MDASDFAVQFDLAASGLIRTIENQLLQGKTESMRVKAELYKLNVYGNSLPLYLSPVESIVNASYSTRQRLVF